MPQTATSPPSSKRGVDGLGQRPGAQRLLRRFDLRGIDLK
jgi:hypothetical protein